MPKEPKRRIRFLTHEEADRLNEALPEHLRPVVRFALKRIARGWDVVDGVPTISLSQKDQRPTG